MTYHEQGNPSKINSYLLSETIEARRKHDGIFKVWKLKQSPVKLSFKNEVRIKTLLDKQKLREFFAISSSG